MKTRALDYLLAIVIPPLYFALQKKWLAATIHSVIYLLAILTLIFFVGVFFWLLGCGHALWDLRARLQEDFVQRQAQVMAEKLSERST